MNSRLKGEFKRKPDALARYFDSITQKTVAVQFKNVKKILFQAGDKDDNFMLGRIFIFKSGILTETTCGEASALEICRQLVGGE
jgi:hypothetical protein